MNYVKKMCILRQLKQGFSCDGKSLSGLIKVEQYGKNMAIEVSVINFAPLVSGEYYCVIADCNHRTEVLPLRGKSVFNILSDLNISQGFCAVICFIKNDISPIAYGVNGDMEYDWKKILNATLPPSFLQNPQKNEEKNEQEEPIKNEKSHITSTPVGTSKPQENAYNDEEVATLNYYSENENERGNLQENIQDASTQIQPQEKGEQNGNRTQKNENDQNLLHPFTTSSEGYYQSVKEEIDRLFASYPRDDTLCKAWNSSEWVRVKGEENAPQYLVGVVRFDGKARYICYALACKDKENPPKEIASVCTFVPLSPFQENEGFFVIFQSAATGECIRPNFS